MSKELPDGSELVISQWSTASLTNWRSVQRHTSGHMPATWTHRWVQLVAMAISSSSHQSVDEAEVDEMKKEMKTLRNQRDRSRTLRGGGKGGTQHLSFPAPSMLALPALGPSVMARGGEEIEG